jgi:hypothetical protein
MVPIPTGGTKDSEDGMGMVMHAYNSSTREAEAGGALIPGQPGLHSEILTPCNPPPKKEQQQKKIMRHTMLNPAPGPGPAPPKVPGPH